MGLARTLDVIAGKLENASSLPLSGGSCLVNRAELLALVERARGELPAELEESRALLGRRDELLDDAEREALRLVDGARRQAGNLVGTHAIVTVAQRRAEQILDAARAEAARLLRDADEYCDRRLADLEEDLDATLGQVRRGRVRLRERSAMDREAPEPHAEDHSDDRTEAAEAGEPEAPQPPAQRVVLDVAGLERAPSRVD